MSAVNLEKSIINLSSQLDGIVTLETKEKKDAYLAFLISEYLSSHHISMDFHEIVSLIQNKTNKEISGWDLINYGPDIHLFMQIHNFNTKTEPRWVLILKSIRDYCQTRFLNFPELSNDNSNLASEVQLLKLFEWKTNNPDNFAPIALISTLTMRLIRMNWIEKTNQCYFFLCFMLRSYNLESFNYTKNFEYEFNNMTIVESGKENIAISKFAKFIEEQLAIAREEFNEQQSKLCAQEDIEENNKFLFGRGLRKGDPRSEPPDSLLLHEEAEFIAQQSYNAMQKHCKNLDQTDQDLRYLANQSKYDRRLLPSLIKKMKDYLDHEIFPSEIRWFNETQVKLLAPHGSYWRGRIPDNMMNAITIEMNDQIIQLYLMELSWVSNDPQSILKKTFVHREILRRVYLLDLKSEESEKDWISINREVFFQFLGRLEEETVKWNKRKSSAR